MSTIDKFIALDLELNNKQDGTITNPKIIQVGVCIGGLSQSEEEWIIRKWYIDPHEPIDPFITQLTGITDDDIRDHSQTHAEVADELGQLITEHSPFMNPVTWGGADSLELLAEFKQSGIVFPYFGRRWIDVKTIHTGISIAAGKLPHGGLAKSMAKYGVHFKGSAHRADVDAYNTLRLFSAIIERYQTLDAIAGLAKGVKSL